MSSHLGPIHYQLYNRIQYEERLVSILVDKVKPELLIDLNKEYPPIKTGTLEDVININAIHQWLSLEIEKVETRLGFILNNLTDQEYKKALDSIYDEGLFISKLIKVENLPQLIHVVNSYLLDGMPCDGGVEIVTQTDNEVLVKYSPEVHHLVDFDKYMELRFNWLKGLVQNLEFEIIQLSENIFSVREEV